MGERKTRHKGKKKKKSTVGIRGEGGLLFPHRREMKQRALVGGGEDHNVVADLGRAAETTDRSRGGVSTASHGEEHHTLFN